MSDWHKGKGDVPLQINSYAREGPGLYMTAVRRNSEGVKPWGRDEALTPADLRHVARLHGGRNSNRVGPRDSVSW